MLSFDLCLKVKDVIVNAYVDKRFNVRQTSEELVRQGHPKIGASSLRRFLIGENLLRNEIKHPRDEKKRQELTALKSIICKMYVDEKLSVYCIRSKLLENGHKFSKSMIRTYLVEWNCNRTLSMSNSVRQLKSKLCQACCNVFKPKAPHQQCCEMCVPFTNQARGRWNKFQMTQAMYDEILHRQNSKCALCFRPFSELSSQAIHLDHCHDTHVVRGILCSRCNHSISVIEQIPGWAIRAEAYVKGIKCAQ